MITAFQKRVYDTIRKIPHGKVSTYSQIARAIGQPGASRAVGNALNKNPNAPRVPCHRVVRSDLTVGGYAHGTRAKIRLLKKEGIAIRNGKVNPYFKWKNEK